MRTAQATRTGSDDPSGPKSRPWRLARSPARNGRSITAEPRARSPRPNTVWVWPSSPPSPSIGRIGADCLHERLFRCRSGPGRRGQLDRGVDEPLPRRRGLRGDGASRESGGAVQARKFLVGRRQPAGDAHPA